MELSYLREFVTFSQYLNVSEAAKHLFISQPTLSSHIQSLEKELGVSLVVREKSLRLSYAGQVFVSEAAKIILECDDLVRSTQNAAENESELTVSLNAVETGPHKNWSMFNFMFMEEHASIHVSAVECTHSTAQSALEKSSADCVIVYVCPIESDLDAGIVYERIPDLIKSRLCIWVNKSSILAQQAELHYSDLANAVHPLPDSECRLWATSTVEFFKQHNIPIKAPIRGMSGIGFMRSMGKDEIQLFDESYDNMALSLLSDRTLKPIDEPDALGSSYIAYSKDRISPALSAYLDYMHSLQASEKRNAESPR